MKRVRWQFLAFIFILAGISAIAQQKTVFIYDPTNPAFADRYKNIEFNGKFSIHVATDDVNNYYLVDFTKLPTKFEKVYFINLVFQGGKAVNIESDIMKDKVWFLSDKKNEQKDVFLFFDELKAKTEKAVLEMTPEEKAAWLKQNDKYK
jgi:hypothetical protein